MTQTASTETKHSRTLANLRRTICLALPDHDVMLHETALTSEYGMSRTPIRQVLQRLAYERLVETRSGVGTVVTPLLAAHRGRDHLVHRGLVEAASLLDIPELSIAQHSDIAALGGMADLMEKDDRELQYDIWHRLHAALLVLIQDPVLQDAFSASFWRIVRWHMHDHASDPSVATESLRKLIKSVAGYEPRNGRDLLRRAADY